MKLIISLRVWCNSRLIVEDLSRSDHFYLNSCEWFRGEEFLVQLMIYLTRFVFTMCSSTGPGRLDSGHISPGPRRLSDGLDTCDSPVLLRVPFRSAPRGVMPQRSVTDYRSIFSTDTEAKQRHSIQRNRNTQPSPRCRTNFHKNLSSFCAHLFNTIPSALKMELSFKIFRHDLWNYLVQEEILVSMSFFICKMSIVS